MAGDTNKCGRGQKVCEPQDYSVYNPQNNKEGFHGCKRIIAKGGGMVLSPGNPNPMGPEPQFQFIDPKAEVPAGWHDLIYQNNPATPGAEYPETTFLLKENILAEHGLHILTRSNRVSGGYLWFACESELGSAGALARNVFNAINHKGVVEMDEGFAMSEAEAIALGKNEEMRLSDKTFCCIAENMCPNDEKPRGIYWLSRNEDHLTRMIAALDDTSNGFGIWDKDGGTRRKELRAYLQDNFEDVMYGKTLSDRREERQDDQMFWNRIFQAVLSAGSMLGMGIIFKMLGDRQMKHQEKLMGIGEQASLKDFTVDMIEEQRRLLKEDRALNEIHGRDAEAIEYLKGLARPEYANPVLVGDSGVGKDKVVERAAQLIALNDPRVPKGLKGLILRKVDPNKLQSAKGGKMTVGEMTARYQVLIDAMRAGEAIYFPEIADFIKVGSHSGGDAESLGAMLKPVMTEKWCRWSASTTTENMKVLLSMIKDLKRRSPVINVSQMQVSIIDVILRKGIAPWYASHYGVKLAPDAVKAVLHVGLEYWHHQDGWPRVDAVKQTLLSAIEYAIDRSPEGAKEIVVTKVDVAEATAKEFGISVDPDVVFRNGDAKQSMPEDAVPERTEKKGTAREAPGGKPGEGMECRMLEPGDVIEDPRDGRRYIPRVQADGTMVLDVAPFDLSAMSMTGMKRAFVSEGKAIGMGALPFAAAGIGADIIRGDWEKLSERSALGFVKEYGPLAVGGSVGQRMIEPFMARFPALAPTPGFGRLIKRSVPLVLALTAADMVHRGEFNAKAIATNVTTVAAGVGIVHGALNMANKLKWVQRGLKAGKLVKVGGLAAAGETGGLTLAGSIAVMTAEFVVIGYLADGLVAYDGWRNESAVDGFWSDARTGYHSILERMEAGDESVTKEEFQQAGINTIRALKTFDVFYAAKREGAEALAKMKLEKLDEDMVEDELGCSASASSRGLYMAKMHGMDMPTMQTCSTYTARKEDKKAKILAKRDEMLAQIEVEREAKMAAVEVEYAQLMKRESAMFESIAVAQCLPADADAANHVAAM